MVRCDDYAELLLDYLYGLLDESQAQQLRAHLEGCPKCQQALVEAKSQQSLLARAARKFNEVPEFQPPVDDGATQGGRKKEEGRKVLEFQPGRARASWRRWLAVGAAASLLLAVGTLYAGYQQGLDSRRQALAEARNTIQSIDDKLLALARHGLHDQAVVAAMAKHRFLHVQLLGPARLESGSASAYRVTTQSSDGLPAPGQIVVKLVNSQAGQKDDQVLFTETIQTNGEGRFVLPAKLKMPQGAAPQLVVEANSALAREVIEQPLALEEPTYVTHIALNKTRFGAGDTVFFRTVTLHRYALTPIDRPVPLAFTLFRVVGSNLEPVKLFQSTTGPGGVAGGEFVITNDIGEGDYRLILAEAVPSKDQPLTILGASRQLSIEPLRAVAQRAANESKEVAIEKAAQMQPQLKADFFPEGGDLVAGTPNRVYVRLQLPPGIPRNLTGVVEDSKQQTVGGVKFEGAGVSPAFANDLALGVLTITPRFGESYQFRVTADGKEQGRLPLPVVVRDGVTMSVPHAVVPAGQPLEIMVRGPVGKQLLVIASCRGRTVDQRIVTSVSDKLTNVALEPVAGCHGVIRVTVYQEEGQDWIPVAERLVYRFPTERLVLSAAVEGTQHKPGDKVTMQIESRDEAGKLTPAWLFGLVIDEQARRSAFAPEASLPAYFLMTTALQEPEELEDADILIGDAPEAAAALDLLLGTQGWRRFVRQPAGGPRVFTAAREQRKTADLAFVLSGTRLEAVQNRFAAAVNAGQKAQEQDYDVKRLALQLERDTADARFAAAARALDEYQQRPQSWLRYGVAGLLVGLFVSGALLLLTGLIVALRARTSPRLMLAGSSALLLLALVLFAGTGGLRTNDGLDDGLHYLGYLRPEPPLLPNLAQGQKQDRDGAFDEKNAGVKVTSQVFAQVTPKEAKEQVAMLSAESYRRAVDSKASETLDRAKAEVGSGVSAAAPVPPPPPMAKQAVAGAKGGGKGADGGGFGGGAGALPGFPGAPGQKSGNQGGDKDQLLQQSNIGQAQPAVPNNMANNLANFANLSADARRQYANLVPRPGQDQRGTVLWQPLLIANDGRASVTFDLGPQAANYHIVIYGNTADGRLGVYRRTVGLRKEE